MPKEETATESATKNANEQLGLVLGFFPRVDGMLSVVLGVDLAMLGALASYAEALRAPVAWHLIILVPAALLAASLWFLYQGAFPKLAGGEDSLVYFSAIASRTEANFVKQFQALSARDHEADVLGQVWRNSVILKQKYSSLKIALVMLGLSVLPWVASIVVLSVTAPAQP